jgi:AcrR family transcriptional regulator
VAGRLSRLVVVEAAEALVDRDGWQQLTMTALARKLGVRGPSLYNHIDGVEALVAEVQVRALDELSGRLQRAAMGRVGEKGFRALAEVLRGFAAEHPGLYELALSEAFDQPRMVMAGEPARAALSAVIESFGIGDPPLELLWSCLATLHGVIALDRTRLFAGAADSSVVYEQAVDLVVLLLTAKGAG